MPICSLGVKCEQLNFYSCKLHNNKKRLLVDTRAEHETRHFGEISRYRPYCLQLGFARSDLLVAETPDDQKGLGNSQHM